MSLKKTMKGAEDMAGRHFIIPTEESFSHDQNISDRLYSYLLLKSELKDTFLLVDKYSVNYLSKELSISRETCKKRLNYLFEKGYLVDTPTDKNLIFSPEIKYYVKIDGKTLNLLYHTGVDNIIKVYAYLKSLSKNKRYGYWFSYYNVLLEVGYKYTNNMNVRNKAKNIISKLREIGLLEITSTEGRKMFYKIK